MSQDHTTTDRLFQATRNVITSASLRANQYKQVVQKKIDLGAIHKKIDLLHTELGKQLDDLVEAGVKEILLNAEVARIMEKLRSLKQAAALLEEEIELIRSETSAESRSVPAETADSAGEKPSAPKTD